MTSDSSDVANRTKTLNNRISTNHLCLIINRPQESITPEKNKHIKYFLKCIPPANFRISINDKSNNKHSNIILLKTPIDFNKSTVTLRKNREHTVSAYMSQRRYSEFKKAFLAFAGGIT